jgi:hypothetical protein
MIVVANPTKITTGPANNTSTVTGNFYVDQRTNNAAATPNNLSGFPTGWNIPGMSNSSKTSKKSSNSGASTPVLTPAKPPSDPFVTGKWIDPMVSKWADNDVRSVLGKYRDEYIGRRDAHQKAMSSLTNKSTLGDMKDEVEKIRPGTYKVRTSSNSLNPNTGVVSIASYVPSDEFLPDINGFMNNQMGQVHEPVHKKDLNSIPDAVPIKNSGIFWADSEVRAYQANIDAIDKALWYMDHP